MYKNIMGIFLLWVLTLCFTMAQSVVVLQSSNNILTLTDEQKSLTQLIDTTKVKSEIVPLADEYLLILSSNDKSQSIALLYLKAKKYFPNAFVLEDRSHLKQIKNYTQTTQPSYTKQPKISEQVIWIAMFALAFVGIFFMFISSQQIEKMKKEHAKMQNKHQALELKQSQALSSMSENIQSLAKETMKHTHYLAQKVRATPLYEDVEKVMHNENVLLDVTRDLVKFLRLKSKKVTIHKEVCNFNHILNEAVGLLGMKHKESDVELFFDIDKSVPKNIVTDGVQLGQIILNLLEYAIENSTTKETKVEATTSIKNQLAFQIYTDIDISMKDKIFDSYYDEQNKRYVGLGIFVAKELIYLMGGKFDITQTKENKSTLIITIPLEVHSTDKRHYRLPSKMLVGKKILIVDSTSSVAHSTEKFFAYFKAEIELMSPKEFQENISGLEKYEIVVLCDELFDNGLLDALTKIKEHQELKVISLENLFGKAQTPTDKVIDVVLKKPLTQEYVFDVLVALYKEEPEDIVHEEGEFPVYDKPFEPSHYITLESFSRLGKAQVLLVEDDTVNQEIFLEMLSKSNIEVSIAKNGEEAISMLTQHKEGFDMIFMDINIPVLDGHLTTQAIRKNMDFSTIPILFLCTLDSEHEIDKMLQSGMNGYICKPLVMGELYTALQTFLAPYSMLEGLNIEEGLSNMQGNSVLYKQILQEFKDAYSDTAKLVESLEKEKRYGQIKILTTELKGLTGTIGAKEMHVVVTEMYQLFIYNKPQLLHSYVKLYQTTLSQLIASIDRYLSI